MWLLGPSEAGVLNVTPVAAETIDLDFLFSRVRMGDGTRVASRGSPMSVAHMETGVLYCEDNLPQLVQFPDECVDLIYLDPPFFSNRHYEVIWGDEAEVRSFEDRWEGGIQVYINWMRDRMVEIHRVLRPTGSVYMHCDYHASHYLKVMMDNVFGHQNFRNEVIWCYRGGGVPRNAFARKHDSLMFYAKSRQAKFNPQYVPYSEASQALVSSRGGRSIDNRKRDLDRGAHMPDWWSDINSLQTWSPERLGYPTQKPVALLERVIAASSDPGDVVLDPFCGCGTTIAAAVSLGREWVGIDISHTAVNIIQERLDKMGVRRVKAIGMPTTLEQLQALKPFEFQNWVIQRFHGTHSPRRSGDMGIDGYSFMTHDPIQVKQSERVGRNVVDNFETAIERSGKTRGYIVGFSFTRNAREEVARARWEKQQEIVLVRVDDLLNPPPRSHPPLIPELASVSELPPRCRERLTLGPPPRS